MKLVIWTLTALSVVALTLSGCGNKGGVDTAPLEKSFASAEPATKTGADQAVSAIKASDYAGEAAIRRWSWKKWSSA